MRRIIVVNITIFITLFFNSVYGWNTRGLSPERLDLYQSRIHQDESQKVEVFCCLDNDSRCVPVQSINDNFCDCNDGSDEPGTSACAQRQDVHDETTDVKFWCQNEGFLSVEIPRWKINDGICDCCDGSDEIPFDSTSQPSPCPNTCERDGKVWRAEEARIQMEHRKGIKKVIELSESGTQTRNEWKREKDALSTKQIPELRREIQTLRGLLSALQAKREEAVRTSTVIPSEAEQSSEKGLESDVDDDNEIEGVEGEKEADKVSEYTRWMEKEKKEENGEVDDEGVLMDDDDDHDDESPLGASMRPIDLKDPTKEATLSTSSSWFHRVGEWFGGIWESQFGLDAKISKASDKMKKLEASLRQLEERDSELNRNLQIKGGVHHQFIPLLKQCFSKAVDKYVYEVCLLDNATQKDGTSRTNLGRFSDLSEITEEVEDLRGSFKLNSLLMKFTGGAYCWSGPNRSIAVTLRCGSTNELLSIAETERCVYSAVMTSPAACPLDRQDSNSDKGVQQIDDQSSASQSDEL